MSMLKKPFSRRSFLRGTGGVAIGLPLLELTAGKAWAADNVVDKRFIAMFSHGGEIMCRNRTGTRSHGEHGHTYIRFDDWAPVVEQEQLTPSMLGATHRGLFDRHLSKMLLLRGIDNSTCMQTAPYNGGHGWANVTALTASDVDASDPDNVLATGPSIDTIIAQRLGTSPLRLEIEGHNYGTPFFQAARQKASGTSDVQGAFDSLFADLVAGGARPDPAVLRRRALKQSVLDGVLSGLQRFRGRVGAVDRDIVDAHLDNIRALELRIADFTDTQQCAAPGIGGGADGGNQELAGPLMVDILIAAIACGKTQVGTFEIGDLITGWLGDPWNSAFGIGHSLHHGANDVGPGGVDVGRVDVWRNEMLDNRRWRLGLLARLMDGLESIQEGNATALDNSLILYTSEFSAAAFHSSADVPLLLAGSAGGFFRTGRHINHNTADPATNDYAPTASTHSLFTSVLNAFGGGDTSFGSDHAYRAGALATL